MKHAKLLTLLAVLVIASMVLAACPAGEVDTGAVATQVVAAVQTAAPTLQAVATEVAPVVEQAATQVAEAIQPSTEVTATAVAEEEDPCAYGGIIKDIVAVDELTVRFDLCVPDPAFPAKAADTALQILPSEFLERAAGTNELLEQPIGTGPYMLKEWRRGDQMIMEANPNYWGEAPFAQTLVFRWTPEAAQRLLELQAGNVNGIDNPGPDDFEVIEGDANLTLYPRAGTNVFYVGMNNAFPPFDNERVRQAFAMAIDRDRIVENFYPAGSLVATQFMPPSIFGYSEGLDWYEYNPEMAKQILEEEGVYDADGTFNTIISYRDVVRGYLPEPGVVAQDIQAQLAEIGVNAEINVSRRRPARRLPPAGLGRGLSRRHQLPGLPLRPRRQQAVRRRLP